MAKLYSKPIPDLSPKDIERFWSKVDQSNGPDSCWKFQGARDETSYGIIRIQRSTYKAHRVAWTLINGDVPPGLALDHLCRVPACCNPSHLEPVTNAENIRRGIAPTILSSKTGICLRGHRLEEGNLYWTGKNYTCRICRNRNWNERYHRKAG